MLPIVVLPLLPLRSRLQCCQPPRSASPLLFPSSLRHRRKPSIGTIDCGEAGAATEKGRDTQEPLGIHYQNKKCARGQGLNLGATDARPSRLEPNIAKQSFKFQPRLTGQVNSARPAGEALRSTKPGQRFSPPLWAYSPSSLGGQYLSPSSWGNVSAHRTRWGAQRARGTEGDRERERERERERMRGNWGRCGGSYFQTRTHMRASSRRRLREGALRAGSALRTLTGRPGRASNGLERCQAQFKASESMGQRKYHRS